MTADAPRTRTLSTGHEVTVPLVTEASATALVLTGDAELVDEWLPQGLAPVRVFPGRAVVTLLSVDYRRIGDDAMAPYDEFGVLVAATPTAGSMIPELGALWEGVGGYVAALPVTTRAGCALGIDVWGYPKTVADISIRDCDGLRRTTVASGDGHLATLETSVRPRVSLSLSTASFTAGDGADGDGSRLRRQPLELSGRFGARPLAGRASLGDHPVGRRLQSLDLGKPLLSAAFEGTCTIGPSETRSGDSDRTR